MVDKKKVEIFFVIKGKDIYLILLTLLIMMDFPLHIDTISMDLSNLYSKGSQVNISKF